MSISLTLQPPATAISPDAPASLIVRLRNDGDTVERFAVDVLGPAASWAETPEPVSLFPGHETDVAITLRPPRQGPAAGPVTVGIRVVSSDGVHTVADETTVTIAAAVAVDVALRRRTSRGMRRGRHRIVIANTGNTPSSVGITASDRDDAVSFQHPPRVDVPFAETAVAKLVARPTHRPLIGRPAAYPFVVRVTPTGADPIELAGTMRQRPLLRPSILVAAGAVALAALVGLAVVASGGPTSAAGEATVVTTIATATTTPTTVAAPPPETTTAPVEPSFDATPPPTEVPAPEPVPLPAPPPTPATAAKAPPPPATMAPPSPNGTGSIELEPELAPVEPAPAPAPVEPAPAPTPAPTPQPTAAPPPPAPGDAYAGLPYGPHTCTFGFVWREATPLDFTCVTGASRSLVASENADAFTRWDPHGAYGSKSCVFGYVWREATPDDLVCVVGQRRSEVVEENKAIQDRRAASLPPCQSGFVFRQATPTDRVCVTPGVHSQVMADNQAAAGRVDPSGAWGPHSCVFGYVWREATADDLTCVVGTERDQSRQDNKATWSRLAPL